MLSKALVNVFFPLPGVKIFQIMYAPLISRWNSLHGDSDFDRSMEFSLSTNSLVANEQTRGIDAAIIVCSCLKCLHKLSVCKSINVRYEIYTRDYRLQPWTLSNYPNCSTNSSSSGTTSSYLASQGNFQRNEVNHTRNTYHSETVNTSINHAGTILIQVSRVQKALRARCITIIWPLPTHPIAPSVPIQS